MDVTWCRGGNYGCKSPTFFDIADKWIAVAESVTYGVDSQRSD